MMCFWHGFCVDNKNVCINYLNYLWSLKILLKVLLVKLYLLLKSLNKSWVAKCVYHP